MELTFLDMLPVLLDGIGYTVAVTLVALAIGLLIGVPLAIGRVYGRSFIQWLSGAYIVIMRGFPSLVILFVVYYVLAAAVDLPPFLAGCAALGVASSAYQAEIFRGAIQGIPAGQMMAARALGMSRRQAIVDVILPQAFRLAIPGWSNEAAVVVKDSSLVYAVGLTELMRRAQQVNGTLRAPLLVFSVTGLLYFLLTFVTNRALDWVENRTRIPDIGDTSGVRLAH